MAANKTTASVKSILDKRLEINTTVRISGKKTDFAELCINQDYSDHHHFIVKVDSDVLSKSFMDNSGEQIALIGEKIVITMQYGQNTGSAYRFEGIITTVSNEGREGKHGYLVLEGYSPTIMLEQGKRMEVYSDMTLDAVFNKVVDERVNYGYLQKTADSISKDKVDFLLQYNESDWHFLRRVAALYGENIHYTGTQLHFGRYDEQDPIEMTYDKEITEYKFISRLLPNHYTNYHYNADKDDTLQASAPDKAEGGGKYVDKAQERSNDLTEKQPPLMPLEVAAGDESALQAIMNRKKIRTAAQTVVLEAEAKTFEAGIGKLITFNMPETLSTTKSMGTYRIIKSKHVIDQNQRYSCHFEAVPSGLSVMPMENIEIPQANSLIGKVRDNADPMGQGRVIVEFPFAQNYNHSWLRVMTPDAGSSDVVNKNRGMVFIPEIGDQVMVGFEFGDPNRPYVMGSMFHGNNGSGGGSNNNIKSIITKSGIKIVFDDEQKSLTLSDPSGNTFVLDGNKNITLTAPETITVNGKNMIVNVDEDVTYNVGKNLTENITDTITQNSKTHNTNTDNMNDTVKADLVVKVTGDINTDAAAEKRKTGGNFDISSGDTVTIAGSNEVKLT